MHTSRAYLGGRIFVLGSFAPTAPGARCVCANDLPRPTESDPSPAARRSRASCGRCPSRPSVSVDSLPPAASTRPSVCPGRCGTCAPCGRRRRPRIVARLRRARSGPSGTPCTSCAACRSWRSARTPRRAASCRTTRRRRRRGCVGPASRGMTCAPGRARPRAGACASTSSCGAPAGRSRRLDLSCAALGRRITIQMNFSSDNRSRVATGAEPRVCAQ